MNLGVLLTLNNGDLRTKGQLEWSVSYDPTKYTEAEARAVAIEIVQEAAGIKPKAKTKRKRGTK